MYDHKNTGVGETCLNPKKKVNNKKGQQTINFKRKTPTPNAPVPAKKQTSEVDFSVNKKNSSYVDLTAESKSNKEESADVQSTPTKMTLNWYRRITFMIPIQSILQM